MTLPPEQLQFFARFFHPHKLLPPLPGVNDALPARIFGIDDAQYAAALSGLQNVVDAAAARLLEDPASAATLKALASKPLTIVGLGDSLTDDSLGWFEILRAAARISGEDTWTLVNQGVSGQTSVEMLARMPQLAAAQPDIVICLAGTNDTRRFGGLSRPQLSLDATVATLRAAREFASLHCSARWLWATPLGIDEEKAGQSFLFKMAQVSFVASDVEAIAKAIASFDEPVANLYGCLAAPGTALSESMDGVHPEPAGHVAIARTILASLRDLA